MAIDIHDCYMIDVLQSIMMDYESIYVFGYDSIFKCKYVAILVNWIRASIKTVYMQFVNV